MFIVRLLSKTICAPEERNLTRKHEHFAPVGADFFKPPCRYKHPAPPEQSRCVKYVIAV